MHIDKYNFGHIVIDGKEYTDDILIYPDGTVKQNWHRIEGHELAIDDLSDILVIRPNIFIIGTGYYGILKVLPETKQFLKENNIELYEERTGQAVKLFNQLFMQGKKKIMAGFHLTC